MTDNNLRYQRKYKYFTDAEFQRCTPACSIQAMNSAFMRRLDTARSLSSVPFVLTCAFRSRAWDVAKGRSGNSYHCSGRAVDIRCSNSTHRMVIVTALIRSGFNGIGIGRNFIHVDDRPTLCMFDYYD